MAPAAAPEAAFKKDEKVFCFHHELLYEAKILEARPVEEDKKNGFEYRVHYKGWKNTYVSSLCLRLSPLAHRSAPHCGSHVCPRVHFTLSIHVQHHCHLSIFTPSRTPNLSIQRVVDWRWVQLLTPRSWDDWVPEDRLRKLSPENRELANNLRHEMLAAQRAARAQPAPAKKKAQGSARGSEERQTSVSAAPRGQKRVRDNDLEKVCISASWRLRVNS